ncbi:Uncharacterised protein [Mycobacteroides abscessus subsp. abscessus]|nr:hypothetical protein [Mycobacteroides abscessus]SHY07941.1 Uncharacterised protein [Mycobacteroides abscessus subsp. abscessus]SIC75555.1 Uncharacterised protein [Mycobacteroides abscessus subsp. abscessus]SKK35156.1 Uncharacterised protein [Mycobacteroides abscessus subsp. abscessus]SKP28563.1 Uncharacterised protein [Mycobacteroides abscessus subsp. abscessus]
MAIYDGPKPTFAPAPREGRRPERIDELLAELRTYWHLNPDLRLGQIIDIFAVSLARSCGHGHTDGAARNIEDDALIGMLRTSPLARPNHAAYLYLASDRKQR